VNNSNKVGHLTGFGGLGVSMLASGTQVRGFEPGRNRRIFRATNPQHTFLRWGNKAVANLRHVKDPFKWRGTRHLSAKLSDISRARYPLSLLEVSRVVVGVVESGGARGNFQSRACLISLHGCSTSGGTSHQGPIEEEEDEEEEEEGRLFGFLITCINVCNRGEHYETLRTIAKSAYFLCLVCPSVRMCQRGSYRTNFR
jgi:hypothetical protein